MIILNTLYLIDILRIINHLTSFESDLFLLKSNGLETKRDRSFFDIFRHWDAFLSLYIFKSLLRIWNCLLLSHGGQNLMIFFFRVFDLLLLRIRTFTLATRLRDFWIFTSLIWNERRDGPIFCNLDKLVLKLGWHIEGSFLLGLRLNFRKSSVNFTGLGVHWCLTFHRLGRLGIASVTKSFEKFSVDLVIVIILLMNRKLGSRQGTFNVLISNISEVRWLLSFKIVVSLP